MRCSTAGRPPLWPSSRPRPAFSPDSWARTPPAMRRASATACWSIRISPGRRNLKAAPCRRNFVPAIMAHCRVAEAGQSLLATLRRRPELLDDAPLSAADRRFLAARDRFRPGKNLYLALLHHPVLLKHKISGTSSLTNLDVHDIARISRTYGLGGFFGRHAAGDTPPAERASDPLDRGQRSGVQSGSASRSSRLVRPATSLADIVETLTESCGMAPLVIGTSARPELDRKGRENAPPRPLRR